MSTLSKWSDMGKICRICLEKDLNLHSLYNSFKQQSFAFYINSIATVTITEDDKLPKQICKTCIEDLETVVKFKDKCEKSNELLNSLINQSSKDIANKVNKLVEEERKEFEVKNRNMKEINVKDEELDTSIFANDLSNTLTSDYKPAYKKKSGNKIKNTLRQLDCLECGKTFNNETKRKMHWYNVHNRKTYKSCKTCLRVFKSFEAFQRHHNQEVSCIEKYKGIKVMESGNSKTYNCTSCDHKSNSFADIRKHLLRHSGARPYICNLCPKSYKSHKSLSYHKEYFHKLFSTEITCHLCGKVVEGRHKFNRHLHSHDNHKFQCDICKAFIKSKWGLICHIKGHDNKKEYVCESCGKGFNTGFNLRNHIRRVHENVKDRKHCCHLCKYKTKTINNLKEHVLQHAQDKLQCSICSRFVGTPFKLVKHMKLHGEKKHFCLYCNKGFATKKQCTEHVRWVHDKNPKSKNPVATIVKESDPD